MNGLKTTIYRRSKDLPEVEGGNFFHSKQLFEILAKTPRQKPYMVVVEDEQGRIVSHMLGFLRYRTFIFPPFLLVHCRVLGEGEYAESEYPKDELFEEMLKALTQELNTRTLYIEVSHLSQKMLGYRQLKQMGYYPINWMSIHNSLHSHTPEERITEKLQKRIDTAHERGALSSKSACGRASSLSSCFWTCPYSVAKFTSSALSAGLEKIIIQMMITR